MPNEKDKKLFATMYWRILKDISDGSYINYLNSRAMKVNDNRYSVYVAFHTIIYHGLINMVKSRKLTDQTTLNSVTEFIYDYLLAVYKKRYSHDSIFNKNYDNKIVGFLKKKYENVKNPDLKDICYSLFDKFEELYLKSLNGKKYVKMIKNMLQSRKFIIYVLRSISKEKMYRVIQAEIQKIYEHTALNLSENMFGRIKDYILSKGGLIWDHIKEAFSYIKYVVSDASRDSKLGWLVIPIIIMTILLVLWKLFPSIKKLVKKLFSFLKYGVSKFMNVVSRILGKSKSEEGNINSSLLEICVKNKHVRELVEMKLERIDVLLNTYYSST